MAAARKLGRRSRSGESALFGAASAGEPPVLTEREDGSPVELGGFDDAPVQAEPAPVTVDAITEAMANLLDRQRRQLAALHDDPDSATVRRIAGELAETLRELEELKQALAGWSRHSAT